MKKTYPTSTKSQQWAKHLKPFGKRQANKSTRKINKEVIVKQTDDDFAVRPAASRKKGKQKFAIEYHNGNLRWRIWKKYITEGRRNSSLENLIKKYTNGSFSFLKEYRFRAKDLQK